MVIKASLLRQTGEFGALNPDVGLLFVVPLLEKLGSAAGERPTHVKISFFKASQSSRWAGCME